MLIYFANPMPPFNAPKISTRMACVSVFADSNKNLTKILEAHISRVAIKNTTTVSRGYPHSGLDPSFRPPSRNLFPL